mgnify:CR=1 FL=1
MSVELDVEPVGCCSLLNVRYRIYRSMLMIHKYFRFSNLLTMARYYGVVH